MIGSAHEFALLAHAACTWFMVGLIWMVQVVHYPLFARVGDAGFAEYERAHTARITWIVAPVMLCELALAVALVALDATSIAVTGLAVLVGVWASTFALQVPAHARLANRFCADALRRLVQTNWLRTIGWTVRGILALVLLRSGA